jgi:hypothetical protein
MVMGRKRSVLRRKARRVHVGRRPSQTEADKRVLERVFASGVFFSLSFLDAEGNRDAVVRMLQNAASPTPLEEAGVFFSRHKRLFLVSVEERSSVELKKAFVALEEKPVEGGKGSLRAFRPFRSRRFDLVFVGVNTRDVKREEMVDAISKHLGESSELVARRIEVSRDRGRGGKYFLVVFEEEEHQNLLRRFANFRVNLFCVNVVPCAPKAKSQPEPATPNTTVESSPRRETLAGSSSDEHLQAVLKVLLELQKQVAGLAANQSPAPESGASNPMDPRVDDLVRKVKLIERGVAVFGCQVEALSEMVMGPLSDPEDALNSSSPSPETLRTPTRKSVVAESPPPVSRVSVSAPRDGESRKQVGFNFQAAIGVEPSSSKGKRTERAEIPENALVTSPTGSPAKKDIKITANQEGAGDN